MAILIISASNVFAQSVSNDSYQLDTNIITQPTETPNQPNINISQNQNPNLISGPNYQAILGFEDKNSKDPFLFSISETNIDYGEISPTDPIVRSNLLTVSATPTYGYTIQSYENHALRNETSQALIPDTTCDTGTCNSAVSAAWNGTLTYGFGYRCDQVSSSNYCADGFLDPTYFKQFAKAENEQPQNIMQGGASEKEQAQITYKINISAAQASGIYGNSLIYLAVPNF
jgi:hypothetical protein